MAGRHLLNRLSDGIRVGVAEDPVHTILHGRRKTANACCDHRAFVRERQLDHTRLACGPVWKERGVGRTEEQRGLFVRDEAISKLHAFLER